MATTPPSMGASPPNSGAQPPQQQQLSPEQLQQMQLVVKQCMQLLLQDQNADTIIKKAQLMPPAEVLADIVGPLLSKVAESAQEAGARLDMITTLVAGVQVLGLLAEMLFQADVIATEQEAAQVVAQASKIAVDQHNARAKQAGGAAGGQPAPGAQPPGGMMMQGGV